MTLDQSTMRRLAFIKYLESTAVSQSKMPAPLKYASLLTMHDAVELFLQLSSEHLNCGSAHPSFMDYWGLLNPKLIPNELQQQESMRRLNKARVALKHHGTFPSDLDIESFRSSTTEFFALNTPLVFAVEFSGISMVEFVFPESARERLREAEKKIAAGDLKSALEDIAIVFTEVVRDYEVRKTNRFRQSPFEVVRFSSFMSSFFMGLQGKHNSLESKLGKFVDEVKKKFEAVENALKILGLGLDFRKYIRFQQLTPHIIRVQSGEVHFSHRNYSDGQPTLDETQFCFDFVIESSLGLSEFDYTV